MRRLHTHSILLGLTVLFGVWLRWAFGDSFTLLDDNFLYFDSASAIALAKNLMAAPMEVSSVIAFRWLGNLLTAVSLALFGDNPHTLPLFQLAAASAFVPLTIRLARLSGLNAYETLLAALCMALVPIGIQFAGTLSPDPIAALCSWLAILTLLAPLCPGRSFQFTSQQAMLTGFCLALAYLTKEEALKHYPAVFALAAWVLFRNTDKSTALRRLALIGGIPLAAFLTECALLWVYLGSPLAHVQAVQDNASTWQRMGTLDPTGHPWSFTYYLRRLAHPAGPTAFLAPLALLGITRLRAQPIRTAVGVWLVAQLTVLLIGAEYGQIQDRMLQILLPGICLLAALGSARLLRPMPHAGQLLCTAIGVLALLYVLLSKYDPRHDSAPYPEKAAHMAMSLQAPQRYCDRTTALLIKRQGQNCTPLAELQPDAVVVDSILVTSLPPPSLANKLAWQLIYTPSRGDTPVKRLVDPLRRRRQEYPPYTIYRAAAAPPG